MSGVVLHDQEPDMAARVQSAIQAWMSEHDPTGPAGTMTIGTVLTGAAGSAVSVVNVGAPSAAILDISIPRGDPGASPNPPTVAIGTVSTLSAGASATVTNSGTSNAIVLDFGLPRGTSGATSLPNITLAETAVLAISAGFRKLSVACSGALTTDNVAVYPTAATPAGYAIHDTVCTSNGNLQVTLSVPLIALGASYSITCRVLALGR